MARSRRIVIVGAGLGGLAAAIALRRKGFEVQVYEQAAALGEVGAGITITPNALKAFRVLGLEARLPPIAFQARARVGRELRSGRLVYTAPMTEAAVSRFGAGFCQVHRVDLLGLLADAVPAAAIALEARCTGVELRDDGVGVAFADGRTTEGDLLIGCDGIRSTVRRALFGDEPARYAGNLCWRALVPAAALPPGLVEPNLANWMGPGSHVTCYYVREGRFINVVAVRQRPDWTEESWVVPSSGDELLAAFPHIHPTLAALFRAAPNVTKWGQFDRDPSPQWTQGRATLLGDAAHPMLAALGQGAAMAFEDGCVLANWLEAMGDDPAEALLRYEAARKPRTSRMQSSSRAEAGFKKVSSPWARLRRDAAYALERWLKVEPTSISRDWIYSYDPARDWQATGQDVQAARFVARSAKELHPEEQ